MGRYRVAWRAGLTEATGHGEWQDSKDVVESWVEYLRKDPENKRLRISHWVEEEGAEGGR